MKRTNGYGVLQYGKDDANPKSGRYDLDLIGNCIIESSKDADSLHPKDQKTLWTVSLAPVARLIASSFVCC